MTMGIHFRLLQDTDTKIVSQFITSFYTEDMYEKQITPKKIKNTIQELEKHPEKGCIIVAEDTDKIIGYAIVINYWSNEYGGNVLHLDEFYVLPAYRRKGIGTQFLNYIKAEKICSPVALKLEVTKHNKKAQKF